METNNIAVGSTWTNDSMQARVKVEKVGRKYAHVRSHTGVCHKFPKSYLLRSWVQVFTESVNVQNDT